jgi:hypothetical protein
MRAMKAWDELVPLLTSLGFEDVRVDVKPGSAEFIAGWLPGSGAEQYVVSAAIQATVPRGSGCCGSSPQAPCC